MVLVKSRTWNLSGIMEWNYSLIKRIRNGFQIKVFFVYMIRNIIKLMKVKVPFIPSEAQFTLSHYFYF